MGSHEYVATLKGQTLRFPNLAEPVKNWPKGMSPHLEVLTKVQHLDLLQYVAQQRITKSRCATRAC